MLLGAMIGAGGEDVGDKSRSGPVSLGITADYMKSNG